MPAAVPSGVNVRKGQVVAVVMIGVDPHKGSHTAVALGADEAVLGQVRVRASAAQAGRLLAWAQAWPERTWAVEGARGLGHLLAQQLVAAGERVLDVQPKLAARVRLLAAGAVNKNDPNDARSVAVAALRSWSCPPVRPDDHAAVLKIWAKRHRDLSRTRNQVGPVIAATVIGDVRDVSRFASRDRFAAYNCTAPIEVSSGSRIIYRLSLRGNRRLNHAIHMAAITQIRYQHSDGRAYYDKKIAEGKTPKEALRALKRQISDAIYKHLKADAARIAAASSKGPGGHAGNDSVASVAGSHPERRLFGQATPGPATTLRRPADQQKRASSHAIKKTARTT
jgi:transposase